MNEILNMLTFGLAITKILIFITNNIIAALFDGWAVHVS
jgi:hypothetical protein